MKTSEFVDNFIGEQRVSNNFVRLDRTYCNNITLELLKRYCTLLNYRIKYKTEDSIINIFNGVIREKKYYDIILEKDLCNGKRRHGFISIYRNRYIITYKSLREDISNYVFISQLCNSKLLNGSSRFLFEPQMFLEFNKK